MQEEVGGFVEEREPKDVIPPMSEAQLDQRLVRRQPTGSSVDARTLDLACDDHRNTSCCAATDETRQPT
jgi:hypothetical protein